MERSGGGEASSGGRVVLVDPPNSLGQVGDWVVSWSLCVLVRKREGIQVLLAAPLKTNQAY